MLIPLVSRNENNEKYLKLLENLEKVENEKERANDSFKKGDYDGAIHLYTKLLDIDSKNKIFNSTIYANRGFCYQKKGKFIEALQDLNKSIDLNNNYVKAYYRRATVYVGLKNPEKAKQDLTKVLKMDPSKNYLNIAMKDAIVLLEDIQKEEKRHRKKDYYKILEVSNKADDNELRKAFKKLATKWHPDKNTNSEEEKEIAERLFKDINEAYTILSDSQKRRIYDLGGDPNDADFINANEQSYKPYEPTYVFKYSGAEDDKKSKKKSKRDRKSGFD